MDPSSNIPPPYGNPTRSAATSTWTDKTLIDCFPEVQWLIPILMRTFDGATEHFGCRLCIALYGIVGDRVKDLPVTIPEAVEHIHTYHEAVASVSSVAKNATESQTPPDTSSQTDMSKSQEKRIKAQKGEK